MSLSLTMLLMKESVIKVTNIITVYENLEKKVSYKVRHLNPIKFPKKIQEIPNITSFTK